MSNPSTTLASFVPWLLVLVIASVLVLNGASSLFSKSDPALALRLNPLNTEARVSELTTSLALNEPVAPTGSETTDEERQSVRTGMTYAPGDSRYYSMLGEIKQRDGEGEEAEQLYETALALAKTDVLALRRQIETDIVNGDFDKVMDNVDIGMRRWYQYRDGFLVLLAQMSQYRDAWPAMSAQLAARPPWRPWLLEQLVNDKAGLSFTANFLLDERNAGHFVGEREIFYVINSLMKAGEEREAYRFFLFTLSDADRDVSGYVHNSSFSRPFDVLPFNWHASKDASVDISRVEASSGGGSGLRLRFLDSPSKLGGIWQVLSLFPGDYRLNVTYSSSRLESPKPAKWIVTCGNGSSRLVELAIPPGNAKSAEIGADFTVPSGDECALQKLTLVTDVIEGSWRDRLSGSVLFEDVAVTKQQSPTQ